MVTPVSITHQFNGDIAAADLVNAADLDTQLSNLASTVNSEIAERQRTIRDGSGLAPQVVRFPSLHPEVTALLTSGGLIPLQAAAVLSISNVAVLSGLQTIDGYTLLANDRILLVGQSSAINNGLWMASAGAWARPSDSANNLTLSIYTFINVLNGITQTGSSWYLSAASTVGLTAQNWVIYSGFGTVVPVARGGTGATTASGARIGLGGLTVSVDTVAAMTALAGNDRVGTIIVRGRTTKGDGGGGLFYWDAASAAPDDDGTILSSDAGGTGRFIRLLDYLVDVKSFGASPAASNASNKAVLQSIITTMLSTGGTIVIPQDIGYGFEVDNLSTYPIFTGAVKPICVLDYSPGSTYAGYPLSYDGSQIRTFLFTPQTTSTLTFTASLSGGATSGTLTANFSGLTGPYRVTFSNSDLRYVTLTNGAATATWATGLSGSATATVTQENQGQHDGNTVWQHAPWAPNYVINNTADLTAVGSGTRTELDNRRAFYSLANDGELTWAIGQGSQSGASLTDEEMSNFILRKYAVTGDTLGTLDILIVERKTLNWGFGAGTNAPSFSYHFKSVSSGVYSMGVESLGTDCRLVLRTSNGSGDDAGLRNNSGDLSLNISTQGDAIIVNKSNRRVWIGQTLRLSRFSTAYSASMTPANSAGNSTTITATNGTAFTINAPSLNESGILLTVRISNTSGGALGVATWNGAYKMAAWTQPATGFNRSITFESDGTNWIETSRTAADIPN